MPTDLMFHYSSLFSQDLHGLEPTLAMTSCMNPEDAELVGFCLVMINRLKQRDPKRAQRLEERMLPTLEILGMSKWVKGEVTHLGLRLGHRNKQTIDLSSDIDAAVGNTP